MHIYSIKLVNHRKGQINERIILIDCVTAAVAAPALLLLELCNLLLGNSENQVRVDSTGTG